MATTTRTDAYQEVTDRVIAALENGTLPWSKSWTGGEFKAGQAAPLRHCGTPYQGVNILLLWISAAENGFESPFWMTFNQAKKLGGCVRKGSKGTRIVFFKPIEKKKINENTGEEETEKFALLRTYTVFNADQIRDLPAKYSAPKAEPLPTEQTEKLERIASCDAFFANLNATIVHERQSAFYVPSRDVINMPKFETFKSAGHYYGTLAHECVHWTKQEKRCDRTFPSARWGDEGYAAEELVAELGAAFLSADLGLPCMVREDHAPYIAHWLKVLKSDKKAIVTAASYATKAVTYLHSLQEAAGEEIAAAA